MRLSERVQGFITERKSLRGMDPDEVAGANGVFLKMADLEALCNLAKRYEDAPVAELYHTRHERNQYYGELYAENLPDGWEPAYTAIADGQRVRIVMDKEG